MLDLEELDFVRCFDSNSKSVFNNDNYADIFTIWVHRRLESVQENKEFVIYFCRTNSVCRNQLVYFLLPWLDDKAYHFGHKHHHYVNCVLFEGLAFSRMD